MENERHRTIEKTGLYNPTRYIRFLQLLEVELSKENSAKKIQADLNALEKAELKIDLQLQLVE